MRPLPAPLLLVAAAILAGSGVGLAAAADDGTCAEADRADGICGEPDDRPSGDDDANWSGDDGEYWSGDEEYDGEEDWSGDDGEGHPNPASLDSLECADEHPDCDAKTKQGEWKCDDNAAYMNYNCAFACNTCDAYLQSKRAAEFVGEGEFGKPCSDDDYRCAEWAQMGECAANPGYMLRSCRNSCMVCLEGSNQFGIGQRIPGKSESKEKDIEKTKEWIHKSTEYMQRVWKEEEFSRVRHKCRNQHQDCTYWAALGECDANEKYMKTNCAPACESCDQLDISLRCPMEPGNECIWKPGDLNALMETIADDADGSGDYERYTPEVFSRPKLKADGSPSPGLDDDDEGGPWVVLLNDFVSPAEADRLVAIGKRQGYKRSADVGKEKPDGTHDSLVSDTRTSYNTWCQERSCYEDPLVAPIIDRIANATKTEVRNSEYLQMLQYEPGQYYKQHHDYIPHHKGMPCGVRILTLFIYLNDVEGGGGTHFPKLDITVMPKKGSALLWPSVLDDSPESKDGRTDHEALPVEKGIKYGANAWVHSRDFKAAFEKNCH